MKLFTCTLMVEYPIWLCPPPTQQLPEGQAREPNILYDDDADGFEAEKRRIAKEKRQQKKLAATKH